MHEGEVLVTENQVRRLLATQFPNWANLPIAAIAHGGTDHSLFWLGNDLVARMPRIGWAVGQVESDSKWLPHVAPHLPLQVPCPVAVGEPGEDYPWPWTVVPWIPGTNPNSGNVDLIEAAESLGEFVLALRSFEPAGGPVCKGTDRGCPLQNRDEATRNAIRELGDRIETDRVLAAWNEALSAKPWPSSGTWLHGDLEPGNILAQERKIVAVIDFGSLALGDPAVDLLPAWSLFEEQSREAFRLASGADDDMWERSKGWALTTALIALPYYWSKSPRIVVSALTKIENVLNS